jgi:hypothetical protein
MEQLSRFFIAAQKDIRIRPTHILLYLAVFECWNQNEFQNSVFMSRRKIMHLTKIHSIAIYHKYMSELHEFGYFIYEPSYRPKEGSRVWMK